MNLLMSSTSEETIETFAKKIFAIVEASDYEERSSSHYVDDRYFLGRAAKFELKIMLSDDADHSDLPFWVRINAVNREEGLNERDIDEMVQRKFLPSGLRVARIDGFGQVGERRTDY